MREFTFNFSIQEVFRFINFLFILATINNHLLNNNEFMNNYTESEESDDESASKETRLIKFVPNIPGKKIYGSETNEAICTICYETKCDWSLLCNHQYHFDCINEWCSRNKNSCPYCRSSIYFISSPE